MKQRAKQTPAKRQTAKTPPAKDDPKRPLGEHLREFRSRLARIIGAVLLLATGAYFIQERLVAWLLKPAHGQHFIYTAPGGGIGFLFSVCTDTAIVLSVPLIVYEVLGFLRPLLTKQNQSFIVRAVLASGILAALGLAFGYQLGLPLALHFLSHQFTTAQITPLLTISEYLSFVTFYLAGSALLFQLPLLLIIINRIRPIPPRQLLKAERYVLVGALIIAMLMAPTINVIYQLIIAMPIFLTYQIGVGIIWAINRPRRLSKPAVREQAKRPAKARREVSPTGPRLIRDFAGDFKRQPQNTLVSS